MKDVVYDYVTGNEFSMRVRQIATAYIEIQKDLDTEKRSMKRIWTKREKQITLVLDNLSGMTGEEAYSVYGVDTRHPPKIPFHSASMRRKVSRGSS